MGGIETILQTSRIYSVSSFGAVGDGVRDDTTAVQNALNSMPSGAVLQFNPGSTYKTGGLFINNKSDLIIDGLNARLVWASTGSRIGMLLQNTCTNVTIRGCQYVGNQSLVDSHCGIGIVTGANLLNIRVEKNTVTDCTMGISLAADGAGSLLNAWIIDNIVTNVYGTVAGQGYGIHHSTSGPQAANMTIAGNIITGAQRHSIYQAKGVGVTIHGNKIKDHRAIGGVADGSLLPGLVIARSANVSCTDNYLTGCFGGGIYVSGVGSATFAKTYMVVANTIEAVQDTNGGIIVGQLDPATDSYPEECEISNNAVESVLAGSLIQVYNGKRINIHHNELRAMSSSGVHNAIRILGTGDTTGNLYTDQIICEHNTMVFAAGGTKFGYNLGGVETKTMAIDLINSKVIGTATLFGTTQTVTNPNIRVIQYGTGTPEAVVPANPGSQWFRGDGGAATSFYVKETGTDKTGWVGK